MGEKSKHAVVPLAGKLKIAGVSITLTRTDGIKEEGNAGVANGVERTIEVDVNMPPSTQTETFYHEVGHIWLEQSGLKYILNSDAVEEAFAQNFGMFMARFITDNKGLPKLPKEDC